MTQNTAQEVYLGSQPDSQWETEMLQAAQAGDLDAVGLLIDRYRPYLMAVARRTLADQPLEESSSVVQAGAANALERWRQFRGQTVGELLRWLAAIVRNQALTRMSKRKPLSLAMDNDDGLASAGSTPSEQAARRERAARLVSALQELPAHYRQIIELRFFEGLAHEQVARRMERTPDAARCLLVRAIRSLRDLLEADHER